VTPTTGQARVSIPTRLLLACAPFGPRLSAEAVIAGLTQGLLEAGQPEPDPCPLPAPGRRDEDVRALLDALDFDARMRRARAVVIGAERLEERTLAGSVAFEIATRARQGGVPAYAVTAQDELAAFDARILDLQVVLAASSPRALMLAGRKLAEIV
jgi:Glycerate kinase family